MAHYVYCPQQERVLLVRIIIYNLSWTGFSKVGSVSLGRIFSEKRDMGFHLVVRVPCALGLSSSGVYADITCVEKDAQAGVSLRISIELLLV